MTPEEAVQLADFARALLDVRKAVDRNEGVLLDTRQAKGLIVGITLLRQGHHEETS